MASRKEKRIIAEYAAEVEYITSEIISLINNAVTISGIPDNIPQEVVKKWLIIHGQVATWSPTGNDADMRVWKVSPAGIDFYGLPNRFSLIGDNGASFLIGDELRAQMTWIRANTECLPLLPKIRRAARRMVEALKAIDLNLPATNNTGIIEATKENAETLRREFEATRAGIPVIVEVNDKTPLRDSLHYTGTAVPFLVDRYRAYYTEIRDEILVEAGILCANRDKRERVQSAEVSAGATECFDYLGRLVDQFNRDAAPLGWKMEYNTTLSEFMDDGITVGGLGEVKEKTNEELANNA